MPKGFTDCVSEGGKVRTIKGPDKKFGLKAGQYRHICMMKGQMHMGEIRHKQMMTNEKK